MLRIRPSGLAARRQRARGAGRNDGRPRRLGGREETTLRSGRKDVTRLGSARRPSRRMTARAWAWALLALLGLLAGCGADDVTWTMMPAPIIMKDPRLDFTRRVAPEDRDTDVRVLYATTRAPAPAGARERYSASAGDAVRLGLSRGPARRAGLVLRRSRGVGPREPRRRAAPGARHVGRGVRRDGRATPTAPSSRPSTARSSASRTGEAVIYVPGYRVTFDQVMVLHGRLGSLPRALLGGRGVQLAHRDPGVELLPRLPARPRLHPRHRAPGRAGRGAEPGPAPEPDRVQLRLAAARRGARAAAPAPPRGGPRGAAAAVPHRQRDLRGRRHRPPDLRPVAPARAVGRRACARRCTCRRTTARSSGRPGWRAPRGWDARTSTS